MKILVANIGSTSFKFRLFDMSDERELARGGVDRIGSREACTTFRSAAGRATERVGAVKDYAEALDQSLQWLTTGDAPALDRPMSLSAIGFKAVMARGVSGVQRVTPKLLAAMAAYAPVAPAHNPPYIAAMRSLRRRFPKLPLVAVFETGFHDTITPRNRLYACPLDWSQRYGIQRNGFHGASHAYIAWRLGELTGRSDLRIISCHLGGSSSVSAIRAGKSVSNSFGFSPQSGLPHSNRVGDFDPFALLTVAREQRRPIAKLLDGLANDGGLAGLSGIGRDLRDIEQSAHAGNSRAQLALDVFTTSVRHFIGSYLVELGGADVIVFTGGIGEHSATIRTSVCRDLDWFGIRLDGPRNAAADGESCVSHADSRVAVWALPTNEELIVARQTSEHLKCCSPA